MPNTRFFLALVFVAGAALAACSGNFGAGTSAPGGLLPSGPLGGIAPTATPTPSFANNILTYGDSSQFQPLPSAAGYGGAIAFETPSPRPSGFQAIPIGATLTIVAPTDAPDLNVATPGKKGKKRERPARPLVYLSLLATHDVQLSSYPRIAIDVPRDIVTTYRENELNLALYNAGEKDKTYRLSVAEHDTASPPPVPTPGKTAPPPPTSIPVSAGSPGAGASASASATPSAPASVPAGFPAGPLPSVAPGTIAAGVPGVTGASPAASPTLPPQRILFAATATSLKLTANRPVVFALYALPIATPSPSPSPSGSSSPAAGASATPRASGSPQAKGSPLPLGSPESTGSPAAAASTSATAGGAPVSAAPASAEPAPAGT